MTTPSPSLLVKAASAIALAVLASCKPSQPAPEAVATPTPAPAPTAVSSPAATPAASVKADGTPAEVSVSVTELSDPVATVNGEKISKAELETALNSAIQASGMNPADITPEQKMMGYSQILDDLITEKLVQKASENIVVPQADVDAEIAKIKSQFPSEEEYNKQMQAAGQTPEKLAAAVKGMLQQKAWVDSQIGDKVVVTDVDAKKFYDENTAEFQEPETVKASHILIRVEKDASEDVVNQKLAEAKKAQARTKKEDFATVAKAVSEEPGAKESGGDLDYFTKDRMVPEFAEVAFTQKVGTVSEPVRTDFGWHIIKVTDKKPAGVLAYDKVKDQLLAFLKADKQRKAAQDVVKSLRDSAKIDNTLPAPPAAPAAPSLPAGN